MSIDLIDVFTAILLICAVAIPAAFDVKTPDANGKKRVTWAFYAIVGIALLTYLLSEGKEKITKTKEDERLRIADSAANARLDSSLAAVASANIKALAEYNLKIDSSMHGVIQIVKDSSKNVNNNTFNQSVDPVLGFNYGSSGENVQVVRFSTLDSLKFTFEFELACTEANATDIQASICIVGELNDKLSMLFRAASISDGNDLPKNISSPFKSDFILPQKSSGENTYIYMFGTYKSGDGKRPFRLHQLVTANRYTNESPGITPSNRNLIFRYMAEHDSRVARFFKSQKIKF